MKNPSYPRFDESPVHAVVRRRRLIDGTTALLAGLVVLLAAVMGLAYFDLKEAWPEQARLWVISLTGAGVLLLVLQRWLVGRKRRNALAVVKAMETSNPADGQMLRTAWELSGKEAPTSTKSDQEVLASRLLTEAEDRLRRGKWQTLAPVGRLMGWLALSGVLAATLLAAVQQSQDFRTALHRILFPLGAPTYTTVAWESPPARYDDRHPPRLAVTVVGRNAEPQLLVQTAGSREWRSQALTTLADGRTYDAVLTGITGDFQARVVAGDGTTPTHTVKYHPIPRLEEAKVTVHFPDYTGLNAEERPGGDASVVEGSRLDWSFRFNTPPDRVEWSLASDTSAPQTITTQGDGAVVQASWKAPLGKYSGVLNVFDKAGVLLDTWRYEVVGLADRLPTVELLEPVKDIQATCVTELPVRIRARDDFGVAEVGLIMEAAGQTLWTLEKVITERDQRDISELTRAMLETVPLTINDNIKLYAYALDHKPRGGPRSVSALRCIDIRDFKKLAALAKGRPPNGTPLQIAKLNELIRGQRVVVSDCHVLKEAAKDENTEGVGQKCQETDVKQQEVVLKANALLAIWQQLPNASQDDVTLLGTAVAQMAETSRHLTRLLTEPAHQSSDRALSSLLQIRKHLILLIGDAGEGEPDEGEDIEIKSLEELAREAQRLAEEERTVREQIGQGAARPIATLDSSRRQQEVAVADAGELFSIIVTHPQKNDSMLKLMAASENFMRDADERLHSKEHLTALPPLADAEQRLRDLSDFIRAMIEEKLADTLKKMAAKAQADAQKSGSKGQGQGQGSGKGEGEGESSQGGESGKGNNQKGADGKAPELAKNSQGEAVGKDGRQAVEKAARNAELADEILKALEALAAAGGSKPSNTPGGDGNGKTPGGKGAGAGPGPGTGAAELAALRARAGTEALAKDLKALAGSNQGKGEGPGSGDKPDGTGPTGLGDKPGEGENPTGGPGIAKRLEKMAQELNAEAARLNASRLAQLTELREKARALRDQSAQQGEGAAPPEQLLAQGGKPTSPTPGSANGKGEGPGEGEGKPGAGSAKADIDRFSAEAKRLGDETITGLAKQLDTVVPSLSAFDGIIERLDLLMASLPGRVTPQTVQNRVPEKYRREIEAYFRNLSDDFGNEPQ
ncbi:hypothetical protein [Verrucomicrobium sp. BvORR034]|uniref:hypothetical protein n=1 Tax=Verrucomicrobium sp. BvORR034 TaxID=1396418 RepID=UPI0006793427|nr:hypothetical protein [Verrucomicrobium sp. BvORR034]